MSSTDASSSGARSFAKDEAGHIVKGTKRHPDVEDHVTIYPNSTILGGETVIADGLSWADEVARIDLRLGEALNQADLVARGLYPVELETNGLLAALRELAEKISVIYRVRCRLRCAGEAFSLVAAADCLLENGKVPAIVAPLSTNEKCKNNCL